MVDCVVCEGKGEGKGGWFRDSGKASPKPTFNDDKRWMVCLYCRARGASTNRSGTAMALIDPYPTSYFAIYEVCVCNQRIESYPFYGMQMGEDQDDDAIVYFNRKHDKCLAEWGLMTYPDDPLGIRHCPSDIAA
jgi:hypothetical protein